MANSLQLNTSEPMVGLGTLTYTVLTADFYTVKFKTTLPEGSQVQAVVNNNGSPILTVGGGTANLGPEIGSSVSQYFAASDVITVVFSSSAAVDNQKNTVKSAVTFFQGQ